MSIFNREETTMFRRLFASLPAIVFGVLIAVAPQAFAHVCEVKDNMPMA